MFEDAKENGERSSEEYDMEVVLESPIVGNQSMKRSLYCFNSLLNTSMLVPSVELSWCSEFNVLSERIQVMSIYTVSYIFFFSSTMNN
jgi:hypothetical protein